MYKILTSVSLLAFGIGSGANAAESDWSGFYGGVSAGGATTTVSDNYDFDTVFTFDAVGSVWGVLAGYNIQNGNMVYGLEGEYTSGSIEGSGLCDGGTTPLCSGSGADAAFTLSNTISLKARAGYVSGNYLIYAMAGISQADASVTDTPQPGTDAQKHSGYVAGVGVEFMATDTFSIGIEYEYGSYEELSYALVTTPDGIGFDTNTFKVSAKYHF